MKESEKKNVSSVNKFNHRCFFFLLIQKLKRERVGRKRCRMKKRNRPVRMSVKENQYIDVHEQETDSLIVDVHINEQ